MDDEEDRSEEVRNALLMQRLRYGADRFSGRDALRLATMGGARVLGRDEELGSLEPGKLADLAMWRIDDVEHAGIADPVAALTLGGMPPVSKLFVNGSITVDEGELANVDQREIARSAAAAARELAGR